MNQNIDGNHDDTPGEAPSLGATIQHFGSAAREAVESHIALVGVRASLVGSAAKWIALFGILAFIIAFGLVVTMMIGAVLALAPLWGLGWSLLAVAVIALAAIAVCGLGIRAQMTRIKGFLA
ncbi:MAG: hypothetical protein ABW048_13415 [Sphingobium sp.]